MPVAEEDKVFVFYSDNADCMASPETLRRDVKGCMLYKKIISYKRDHKRGAREDCS